MTPNLEMRAVEYSETSVHFYQTTRLRISVARNFNIHRFEATYGCVDT
jgi:hypothetical protein